MNKNLIRSWKKVYENDLSYIAHEMKDLMELPALILLEGPLGAGKTTFAKALFKGEETFSPTYSIVTNLSQALHADFYRLESASEIENLELPLYLEEKMYLLVEWGAKYYSRLSQDIPENFHHYLMQIEVENELRNFSFYSISH
ncbi:MAG: tRNA (adenosine(37)-N6)-threonylcarbamoyltransferase complex ATPase subunit type 1 TsaE [Bacteriovoracaceae bacterium]|nr:tRNA (adenosine(37)-N6)-threonylcarbamoyltransferase complex ATPase subunit type 1 TsaE [Bacteriovoracaceae bacterium]